MRLPAVFTGPEALLARHWSGNTRGYCIAINDVGDGCGGGGQAHFYSPSPCSGLTGTTPYVNDGGWHQLVAVYASGVGSSIYLDGVWRSSSAGDPSPQSITAPFMIGGIYTSSQGELALFTRIRRRVDRHPHWTQTGASSCPGGDAAPRGHYGGVTSRYFGPRPGIARSPPTSTVASGGTRMTPMLLSMLIFVPKGSENRWTLSRMSRALSGEGT